jgi:hypothetical protein
MCSILSKLPIFHIFFQILLRDEGHFSRPGGTLLARGPRVGNHCSEQMFQISFKSQH